MTVLEYAYSTLGPITYVNWTTYWTNWSRGSGGNVFGAAFQFSASWGKSQAAWTRTGFVTGYMTGWVITALGDVCGFLDPSASINIT